MNALGRFLSRLAVLGLTFLALPDARVAFGRVNPLWQELGGSASRDGVSRTLSPRAVFDGSVAIGPDGPPVVAYTDYPDADAVPGGIIVKRWTGSAWELLSHPAGLAIGDGPRVRVRRDLQAAMDELADPPGDVG